VQTTKKASKEPEEDFTILGSVGFMGLSSAKKPSKDRKGGRRSREGGKDLKKQLLIRIQETRLSREKKVKGGVVSE